MMGRTNDGDAAPDLPRRRFLRDNGLSLVLAALFVASLVAMGLSGWRAHNAVLHDHGGAPLALAAYLESGDFVSAVFENWESEFLQMAAYVVLTAFLFQRGSSESRDPDAPAADPPAPGSGIGRVLYAYSLGLVLAALFVLTFALHLWGSYRAGVADALLHGAAPPSFGGYLADAQFWFESFQNWQSEFLATGLLVVLSIFLRFRGSPESKPVEAANENTGD